MRNRLEIIDSAPKYFESRPLSSDLDKPSPPCYWIGDRPDEFDIYWAGSLRFLNLEQFSKKLINIRL